MKQIILYKGEFQKDIVFDTILYNIGVPERQRKNVTAVMLKVESYEIV